MKANHFSHLAIIGTALLLLVQWQPAAAGAPEKPGNPGLPGCMARISELEERIEQLEDILYDEWNNRILGFYSAPQDTAMVAPGESDYVRSLCDPGDFAISGSWVVYAENFKITFINFINYPDEGQSWVLQGVNEGTEAADIRISARCADVWPRHQ